MFADYFTLKLGDATVKGRRLSIAEIRENHAVLLAGNLDVARAIRLIRDHVTLEDGSSFDPAELSPGQLRKLLGELVLPEEGRGISDFIGLLC